MSRMHPHQFREHARERNYANRLDEDRNVRAVDRAVFDRVRAYEQRSAKTAEAMSARAASQSEELVGIIAALETEVGEPLRNGAEPSEKLAKRYEELTTRFRTTKAGLDRTLQQLDWAEENLRDPYAAYMKMMDKWPIVRPHL